MFISDCCGMPMTGEMVDVGICPDCHEHCEAIDENEDGDEVEDVGDAGPVEGAATSATE